MIHVVLYQPEIPPNTGNIIRLCANTGTKLHLIHPLGFQLEDRALRRAGLDYHEWAEVDQHATFEAFLEKESPKRLFAFSTKGQKVYTEVDHKSGDVLLFGSETKGLPIHILESLAESHVLTLPMKEQSRSLNLSNTVAVVVYKAWADLGFSGAI